MDKPTRNIIGLGVAAGVAAYLLLSCQGGEQYTLRGKGLALDVAKKVEEIAKIDKKQKIDEKTKAKISTAYLGDKSGFAKVSVINNPDGSTGCNSNYVAKPDVLEIYMGGTSGLDFLLTRTDIVLRDASIDTSLDGISGIDKKKGLLGITRQGKWSHQAVDGIRPHYPMLLDSLDKELSGRLQYLRKSQTKK